MYKLLREEETSLSVYFSLRKKTKYYFLLRERLILQMPSTLTQEVLQNNKEIESKAQRRLLF